MAIFGRFTHLAEPIATAVRNQLFRGGITATLKLQLSAAHQLVSNCKQAGEYPC